jgi:hypothetical protein
MDNNALLDWLEIEFYGKPTGGDAIKQAPDLTNEQAEHLAFARPGGEASFIIASASGATAPNAGFWRTDFCAFGAPTALDQIGPAQLC